MRSIIVKIFIEEVKQGSLQRFRKVTETEISIPDRKICRFFFVCFFTIISIYKAEAPEHVVALFNAMANGKLKICKRYCGKKIV